MTRLCHLASVSGFHKAFQRSGKAQATSILKQTNQTKANRRRRRKKKRKRNAKIVLQLWGIF